MMSSQPMKQSAEDWYMRHSDAWHSGSRETCNHCQAMIKAFGEMPSIEELRSYRPPKRYKYTKAEISDDLRWEVWERDNFTCKICGARRNLQVDHIHPESKGGELSMDNLQTLCKSCNAKKGDR